jgi:hypothetical protein
MNARDIWPWILDPAPCFVCERLLYDRKAKPDLARYRVPLLHRQLERTSDVEPNPAAGAAALASLPDIESVRQLRAVIDEEVGVGLFTASRLIDRLQRGDKLHDPSYQACLGSLLVYPPHEWSAIREELAEWFFDGIEAAFSDLPYTFDDVIPFAGPNFSPDRWLLVLRGPMAGNVVWWTHDGDSVMDTPWAQDIQDWGRRLIADGPDVLGGVCRFAGIDSIDNVAEDAVLYPLHYHPDANQAI